MALDVLMPQLGLTMTEGLIAEWKKKSGDAVTKGEVLFSVENDKATIDVLAQSDGVLAAILVGEMETVPVGTVVASIAEKGEGAPAAPAANRASRSEATQQQAPIQATAPEAPKAAAVASIPQTGGFVLASPYARHQAEALGLELAEIRGTGPEGAVLARDVAASEPRPRPEPVQETPPAPKPASAPKLAPQSAPLPKPAPDGGYVDIKLSRIQRISAERLGESWSQIPQFTVYDEADATAILDLAARYKKSGSPVSITVILAKFLALAAERHPRLNASWLGSGSLRQYARAHVNVAVDTTEGLVVPVLRAPASRGFLVLGAEMAALAEKARSGGLGPEDYEGGTITLSNLGMFGISRFSAIVNPPQTAILSVGRIYEKPVQSPSGFVARKYIEYAINADHRAVDGAEAARFLASFKALVENPLMVLD
ncbi:MAG TPA: dihydrolipoamide acetyltransferase family protein [Rectinemataceae bacterium]